MCNEADHIYYILSCGTHPTIRNWSCGHEWEGKRGGFPVPADIFIFIYYICIVAPLGAFKSQLGGTYSISRLFDIFRFISSCHVVALVLFAHLVHSTTKLATTVLIKCVCVCARVHVSAAPIYWKLYVFSIYLRIIRDTKIFRGISRSGTTSPRIRIPLFASETTPPANWWHEIELWGQTSPIAIQDIASVKSQIRCVILCTDLKMINIYI